MKKRAVATICMVALSLTGSLQAAAGAAPSPPKPTAAETVVSYEASYTPKLLDSAGFSDTESYDESLTDIPQADQDWADGVEKDPSAIGTNDLGDDSYNVADRYVVKDIITYNRPGGPGNASLRAGHSNNAGAGFGFRKIRDYHGMTRGLEERGIRFVAQTPTWEGKAGSATAYNGTAYAQEKVCQVGTDNCEIINEVRILMAVDERDTSDANNFGVVTAFCVGYNPVCPSWVNNSLVRAYQGG